MFCILASKWSVVGGRLRIILYRPQEMFWSLNRDSSLLRMKLSAKSHFTLYWVINLSSEAIG